MVLEKRSPNLRGTICVIRAAKLWGKIQSGNAERGERCPVSTDLEMIHGSLRVMWDTADENLALVSISVPVTAGNAHAKVIAFYSSCFDAATSITDADEPVDCF